MLKKIFIASAIFLACTSLHAKWKPESLGFKDIKSLNDPAFTHQKAKVICALKNSWCSEDKANLLMDFIYLAQPKVCVEIGAFTGSTVLPVAAILQHLNSGKVIAIDAWSNAEAIKYMENDDPNKPWWSSVDMKAVHATFQNMLLEWSLNDHCKVIWDTSERAVDKVANIDFIHMDGNYSEITSLRDIELYLPKVKQGGYILLSNARVFVSNKQPKLQAFSTLFDTCEMICEIDQYNTVLFRKP